MSEFKVGDRVRIVESGFVGEIFSVENRLLTSLDGTIEGCCIDFYEVVGGNGVSFSGLQGVELELIEKAIEHEKIKTQEQIKIEQLEQRIEKLEKCVMGEQNSLEKCENVSSMSKLTKGNIEDLKYWGEIGYKWTCKDEKGSIHIFKIKPTIYNIEELLKGECGNE